MSVTIPGKRKSVNRKRTISYETDYFGWTREQADLLQKRDFENLDIEHLREEIESLGNSERNALESHFSILLIFLLKMEYQPSMRSKSWENSVKNAKFRILRLIQKNPGLRPYLKDLITDAYYLARLDASSETGLDEEAFPKTCPWSKDKLLAD